MWERVFCYRVVLNFQCRKGNFQCGKGFCCFVVYIFVMSLIHVKSASVVYFVIVSLHDTLHTFLPCHVCPDTL